LTQWVPICIATYKACSYRGSVSTGLFGRAPAPAPRAAPAGALPNSVNCTGSRCGAGAGAPRGFQRGGGAMFLWLHLAPTRNPPEELFCQTFFKTTQLRQRSHSTRGARAGVVFGGAGALLNRPYFEAAAQYSHKVIHWLPTFLLQYNTAEAQLCPASSFFNKSGPTASYYLRIHRCSTSV
jgi:hypothetical protein